jgi:predicted DNA-binding transcriptional regulator YafY
MDTLLRQWLMLRMIPRFPRKISTADVESRLTGAGYPTTRRTIQRDLDKLSAEFQLISDGNKPAGWSWQVDAEAFDVPGMDTTAALTFRMVEAFLAPLLPQTCMAALSPQMQRAKNILAQVEGQAQATWPDKVQTVPRSQPLLSPELSADVLETTYEALFHDRRFIGEYRSRGEEDYREFQVNPLGLVFADPVIYLVGTLWDYTDVRLLALHRFRSASLLDESASRPDGFDLQAYLQQGVMGILVESEAKSFKLRALFDPDAAYHLLESKLSTDQQVTVQADGDLLIEATVNDTLQLRWWLLGFGAQVEILAPEALRKEFAATARSMQELYS